MKKNFQVLFFVLGLLLFSMVNHAQTAGSVPVEKAPAEKMDKKASPANDSTMQAAEKSLEKAAESIQRSAEKIKIVVEDRAGKIANNSRPAIESFLAATSNLLEKIALELEKMIDEKPVKK